MANYNGKNIEQGADRGFRASDWERFLKEKWYKFPEAEGKDPKFLIFSGNNLCGDCFSLYYDKRHFTCSICARAALTYPEVDIGFYGRKCQSRSSTLGDVLSIGDMKSNSGEMKQIVCTECGYRAAGGKCRTCDVYYCANCFDKLHMGSRVLREHFFHPSKIGQRIGNEIFPLPVQLVCKMHRVPGTALCADCMCVICEDCRSSAHAKHVIYTVSGVNHELSAEIPAAVKCIDEALKFIENAQLVLQAKRGKLEEFAGDALVKILNHFSKTYDFIQKFELDTLRNLRKSSLSLQLPINLAMGHLRDYKELLMNMRQKIYSEDSDQIKVPQDFMLDELLALIHEHLQKMPSTVEVTNVDVTPYVVTIKRNLFKQIRRSIRCQILEPRVQVLFNNECDHKIIITRDCQPPNTHDLMLLNRALRDRLDKKKVVQGCFDPKFYEDNTKNLAIPRPCLSNDEKFTNRLRNLVANYYGNNPSSDVFESMEDEMKALADLLRCASSIIKNACPKEESQQEVFSESKELEEVDKGNTTENSETPQGDNDSN